MSPDLITNSVWDDPRNIETLTAMWKDGAPVIDIAEACGTTRNSVIGKARRLKLPEHANSRTMRAARRNKGQANGAVIAARIENRQRSIALAERQHARNEHRRAGSLPDEGGVDCTHMVGFADRRIGKDCAWISGGAMCCGKPVVEGSEWCEAHYARVYSGRAS